MFDFFPLRALTSTLLYIFITDTPTLPWGPTPPMLVFITFVHLWGFFCSLLCLYLILFFSSSFCYIYIYIYFPVAVSEANWKPSPAIRGSLYLQLSIWIVVVNLEKGKFRVAADAAYSCPGGSWCHVVNLAP